MWLLQKSVFLIKSKGNQNELLKIQALEMGKCRHSGTLCSKIGET